MKKTYQLSEAAFQLDGKMPLKQAIPLGLQHVLAMFVGNLTPLLIITVACGIAGGEFADLQLHLLQNAMLVAGIVTLIQLFSIGPIGGKVPIVMGTSSGFIGVFHSVTATMGGGVIAYGAIMGASIIGDIFEGILGFFLKPAPLLPSGGHRHSGHVHRFEPDFRRYQFLWRRQHRFRFRLDGKSAAGNLCSGDDSVL